MRPLAMVFDLRRFSGFRSLAMVFDFWFDRMGRMGGQPALGAAERSVQMWKNTHFHHLSAQKERKKNNVGGQTLVKTICNNLKTI